MSPRRRPSTDDDRVIECSALEKTFRDFWLRPRVRAVESLDLTVRRGDVLGLVGPNGSGKSTTIKMILGLLFPSSGRVRVFGRSPRDVANKARVGYLPEETHLYPFLDAHETLDFYARLFGLGRAERRRRAEELLTMVGLAEVGTRRVGEFSKGMQRRLGLAQALLNDPDLLILDEPTSGLDPIGTRQVKDLLIALAERGKTLVISSHLLADLEDVCSRLAILYGGRMLAEGAVEELLTVGGEMIVRTDALDDGTITQIETAVESNAGRRVLEIAPARRRLETLFLDLVEKAQRTGVVTSGAQMKGGLATFLARSSDGVESDTPESSATEPSDDPSKGRLSQEETSIDGDSGSGDDT